MSAPLYQLLMMMTDFLWTLSWCTVCLVSYRRKTSVMPPVLLPLILTWEVYYLIQFWKLVPHPVFLLHGAIWVSCSLLNLRFAFIYNRTEYTLGLPAKWFWPKFSLEVISVGVLFYVLLSLQMSILFYSHLIGRGIALVIACAFFSRLWNQRELGNHSLLASMFRILANLTLLINDRDFQDFDFAIWALPWVILVVDLSYLGVYFRLRVTNPIRNLGFTEQRIS